MRVGSMRGEGGEREGEGGRRRKDEDWGLSHVM